jgi:hypothetical protein
MSDAAAPFYQRNYDWHAAQGSVATEAEVLTAMHPVGGMTWLKRLRPQLFCHEITFVLRKPAAKG